MVTDTCSLLVSVNPHAPNQTPTFEFRGPDNEVSHLRNVLAKNLMENQWDGEVDLHLNLLSALELECFPGPSLNLSKFTTFFLVDFVVP